MPLHEHGWPIPFWLRVVTWVAVFGFSFYAFWPPSSQPCLFLVAVCMAGYYAKQVVGFYRR